VSTIGSLDNVDYIACDGANVYAAQLQYAASSYQTKIMRLRLSDSKVLPLAGCSGYYSTWGVPDATLGAYGTGFAAPEGLAWLGGALYVADYYAIFKVY
jgi:hypothetical protein